MKQILNLKNVRHLFICTSAYCVRRTIWREDSSWKRRRLPEVFFEAAFFSVLIQYVHCTCKEAETIVTSLYSSL